MILDRRLRRAIIEGSDRGTLRQILAEGNFVSMADNCRRLVKEGVTTAEEAVKTIHSADL